MLKGLIGADMFSVQKHWLLQNLLYAITVAAVVADFTFFIEVMKTLCHLIFEVLFRYLVFFCI